MIRNTNQQLKNSSFIPFSLNSFLQSAIFAKIPARRYLRNIDMESILQNLKKQSLQLKTKGYVVELLTDILYKMIVVLVKDLNEFKLETFTVKQTEVPRGEVSQRKKRRRTQKKEKPLAVLQKDVEEIIQSQLSSNKHMAQLNDITLRKQGMEKDITIKPIQQSIQKNDDFKQILDNTLLKNWGFNQDIDAQLLPMQLQSSEKKYNLFQKIKNESYIINEEKSFQDYKDLIEDKGQKSAIKNTRRKTNKKQNIRKVMVAFDKHINITSMIQVEQKRLQIINNIQTKRKSDQSENINLVNIDLNASELINFKNSLKSNAFQQTKQSFLDFQKSLLLNSSFKFNFQKPRIDSQRKDFYDLSINKADMLHSERSQQSSSLGDVDVIGQLPQPLSIINQTIGINETTQYLSRTPIKSNLNEVQRKIQNIINRSMVNGKIGFNEIIKQQKLNKKAKIIFFYEMLGLGMNLKQQEPQKFGDIIIIR